MPLQVARVPRGSRDWSEFQVYNFRGGVNVKKAPQELDDTELSAAVNVYLKADGGLDMRNGMTTYGSSTGASPASAIARFYQQVVAGAVKTPATTFTLMQVGGTLYNASTGAQIGATNALGASASSWSVARVYSPDHSGGATDCLVICTGSGGPYLFDGTNITTPAAWSPVSGASWCAVVNNILWFGGIPLQPNLVQGTQLGHPELTLPSYNAFSFSRPVTGLGVVGSGPQAALVVGMNTGISCLYGTGPGTFYLQDIPSVDGVAAGRTMVNYNGVLYFLGSYGIYAFDGANPPTVISTQVEPWILNDPNQPDYPMNGTRTLSFAWVYKNRLHIAYDSGAVGHCNTYLVYDLVVNGWTVLSGPALSGACLLNAPGDAQPWSCVVCDGTKGQAYNWDALDGSGNANDNGTVFTTSIVTKYFKLGMPGTPKRLMRFYPEVFSNQFNATVNVVSDYGASAGGGILPINNAAAAKWDQANWDQATWAGGSRLFIGAPTTRVDTNLTGEAFAFSLTTSSSQPPYEFVGVTGTFVQEAMV